MHLGRGRGSAYPECITHIGAKRIGINKSCVVSHRGALRSAETLRENGVTGGRERHHYKGSAILRELQDKPSF